MVTDALLAFIAWVVETVAGWFPEVTVPAWIGTVRSGLETIMFQLGQLTYWVDVNFALAVCAVVLVCIGIGLLIKITRIVASFLTAGGGSAG